MSITGIFLKTAEELKTSASNVIKRTVSFGQKKISAQKPDEFIISTKANKPKEKNSVTNLVRKIKALFTGKSGVTKSLKERVVPCTVTETGDIIFNTNKTKLISNALERLGFAEDSDKLTKFGKTLSPEQMTVLSKIVNLPSSWWRGAKQYKSTETIRKILSIDDLEFVSVAMDRHYCDFLKVQNKELFKKIASKKTSNGVFVYGYNDLTLVDKLNDDNINFFKKFIKMRDNKNDYVISENLSPYLQDSEKGLRDRLLNIYPKAEAFDVADSVCKSKYYNEYLPLIKQKKDLTESDYLYLESLFKNEDCLTVLHAMERNGLDKIQHTSNDFINGLKKYKSEYVQYFDTLTKLGIKADYDTICHMEPRAFYDTVLLNFSNLNDPYVIRTLKLTNGVPSSRALSDVTNLEMDGIKPSKELDKLIQENKLYDEIGPVYKNKYSKEVVTTLKPFHSFQHTIGEMLEVTSNISEKELENYKLMLKMKEKNPSFFNDHCDKLIIDALKTGRTDLANKILQKADNKLEEASYSLWRALQLNDSEFKYFEQLLADKRYNLCMIDTVIDNIEKQGVKELILQIGKLEPKCCYSLNKGSISTLLDFGAFNPDSSSFSETVTAIRDLEDLLIGCKLLDRFPKLRALPCFEELEKAGGINELSRLLLKKFDKVTSPITPKTKDSMGKFFSMLSPKELPEALNGVNFNKPQFNEGLVLEYPRSKFIEDINSVLQQFSSAEQKLLTNHFGFQLNNRDIINFPRTNPSASEGGSAELKNAAIKLNTIIENFIYKNKVKVEGNPTFEKFANYLIEAFPEFTSIIGKKQHHTHDYTLDIHTLKVLQECVKHPKYKMLSVSDKTILNLSVIFHDLAKAEGIVDDKHYMLSALQARDILNKLKLPQAMSDRIFNFIENHHWLGLLSTGKISPEQVAVNFRYPGDFTLAKIFAKADLKGVGDAFYNHYTGALGSDNVKSIEKIISNVHKSGILLFNTKLSNHYNDYKLVDGVKVIDVANDSLNALKNFKDCKSLKDLSLLVHMVDPEISTFNILKTLCKNGNNGNLSSTIISPGYARTYCRRRYGVVLEPLESNYLFASIMNGSTGVRKGKEELFSHYNMTDNDFGIFISNKLGINLDEYPIIFRNVATKGDMSKVESVKLPNGRIIDKESIKDAIKAYRKTLLHPWSDCFHNEIVAYNPRIKALIALENDFANVPDDIKTFARENDLPLILFSKAS